LNITASGTGQVVDTQFGWETLRKHPVGWPRRKWEDKIRIDIEGDRLKGWEAEEFAPDFVYLQASVNNFFLVRELAR